MKVMNKIIIDLSSKSMMDRRLQSSLKRRDYKIRQRQAYPDKAQDLETIDLSRRAVENMKVAALEYGDFCGGMIGNTIRTVAQANATIRALAAATAAFQKTEADFIPMAKEMIDVNERFCSSSGAPHRHRMHEKPEWKALRREVREM